MKIYLAARFSRRHELRRYAQQLRDLGHHVTSRWIDTDHQVLEQDGEVQTVPDFAAGIALRDLEDLRQADCTISFTEGAGGPGRGRGGRHAEFGAAVILKHMLILVGPRENVFHSLPQVQWFGSFQELLRMIGQLQEARLP